MPFLRKYNTLLVTGTTAIRIPIIKRAVVDFAVGADWTPAAGDVKIFVDGAAVANVTNLPTAIASGNTAQWEFVLTAAELSCKQALVMIADAATKAVEDQSFIVETYGNASAMYQADLSLPNLPANVTQLLGTAWLTPGVAGTPDVNAKQLGAAPVTATTSVTFSANSTVASTTNITAGTMTTTTNLTNLPTIPANWLTAAGTATDFGAKLATAIWGDTTAGDFTVLASIGKSVMNGVALGTGLTINAYTGNTVQTGDSFARIGAAGAGLTNIGTIATCTNLTNAPTAGDLTATMKTSVTTAATAATPIAASVTGAVGSVTAGVTVTTNSDKTGYALSATGSAALTEAYAADGAAPTLNQMLFQIWSALSEFSISGTTITAKKLDGLTTAMTFTIDSATVPTSRTRAT